MSAPRASTVETAPTFEGPDLATVEGIGALTLGGFLDQVAAEHGSREAIVFDDPLAAGRTVRWTYAELRDESRRVAAALVGSGVVPGDTVAVLMGNRPEAVAAILGAASIGAVAAPVSTFSTRPELGQLLSLCAARVVLTQRELLGRRFEEDLDALRSDLPALEAVAALGTPGWGRLLERGDTVGDADLAAPAAAVTPEDPALVIFSSGTTAAPKGVLHTHRAPTLQFWLQARIFARGPHTCLYAALPIFWTAGLNTAVGATLAAGGCWVAQETFDAAGALALMERERVTEPYTLPHQTAALAEHPDWERTDLSSVRCAYGKGAYARHPSVSPDPDWIMPVGYGMSETCAFVSGYPSDTPRDQMKVGNGPLLAGTRLRVLDPDTGRPLGVGEEGELAVGGATLMLGYLGRAAGEVIDPEGFFRTGDAGHVDRDGVVHWSGRRSELIRTAGANVSPAEIEVALRAFAPVKLSRVLGLPDERLGQLVVAAVVCADGATTTEAEVQAFLRERLAAYKVPKRVVFLDADEVPMTAGDTKVRDEQLRARVLELVGDDTAPPGATPRRQERA